ncbi:hypothetical protein OB919_06255 [Halobacteria archaeon AArc-curdl1]|uniref:Uncharacterized protein n=1 Tax=Natronosalvus hydrolyticus TaxID=2979988 RepID=A0AAP2Z6N7_9EURY|nr:hypothetical protein [Halobacteria archaeon AArc-curdl1]
MDSATIRTVTNDPHLTRAFGLHNLYYRELQDWNAFKQHNPNKMFLWGLIRRTIWTARLDDWDDDPDLPSPGDLLEAIDVDPDWQYLFTPTTTLADLVKFHDMGLENEGVEDNEFLRFGRSMASKQARLELLAQQLREHVFHGVTVEPWGVMAGYDEADEGSFMASFMGLSYEMQLHIMAKLTYGMGSSSVGRYFLADCMRFDKGLDVLRFFDPPTVDNPVEVSESGSGVVHDTAVVINAPETPVMEHTTLSDIGADVVTLRSFWGTGETLLGLAYQLLPGVAFLEDNSAANQAVGKLLLPFLDPDVAREEGDDVYEDLMAKLPSSGTSFGDLVGTLKTIGKVGSFAAPLGLDNTNKGFAVFGLFTSGCSILLTLTSDEDLDPAAKFDLAGDFLGLKGIEDALDIVRGQTLNPQSVEFEWGGFPHRISSVLEFVGPLGDVINVTVGITGSIESFASGDELSGSLQAVGAAGGVMTLVSGIASIGTGAIALPWVFAIGVTIGIVSAVWLWFINDHLIEEWIKHTVFGTQYGQGTTDPNSLYYEYDREHASFPEQHIARQISGYYWLSMPISGYSGDQGRSMKAHITKEEPAEPSKYGTDEVYVATLEIPMFGGGTEGSRVLLKPLVRRDDAFTDIMDAYQGYGGPVMQAFRLGASLVDPSYSPNTYLLEVDTDDDRVRTYIRWNWYNLTASMPGSITSFIARFEVTDLGTLADVWGLSKSDLQNLDQMPDHEPYLTVQHVPPSLDQLVESHLEETGTDLDAVTRGELYERLPVFPTRRVRITHDL